MNRIPVTKCLLPLLLLPAAEARAGAAPPATVALDPAAIHSVSLHPDFDTLLMFPEPVTLIAGNGLTRDDDGGSVRFQMAEDPRLVLLRRLRPDPPVLMHVVLGTEGYSIRLVAGPRPASIVRFVAEEPQEPAAVIPEPEVGRRLARVGPERQAQLAALALAESALREKIPEEYEGYRAVPADVTSEVAGLRIRVIRVARFDRDDAVVVVAEVREAAAGAGQAPAGAGEWWLRVGDTRHYRPNFFSTRGNPADGTGRLVLVLVGDGRGGPLHLSPENRFTVTARQPEPPRDP